MKASEEVFEAETLDANEENLKALSESAILIFTKDKKIYSRIEGSDKIRRVKTAISMVEIPQDNVDDDKATLGVAMGPEQELMGLWRRMMETYRELDHRAFIEMFSSLSEKASAAPIEVIAGVIAMATTLTSIGMGSAIFNNISEEDYDEEDLDKKFKDLLNSSGSAGNA